MKVVHLVQNYYTPCGRDMFTRLLMLTRDRKKVTCKQCLKFMRKDAKR